MGSNGPYAVLNTEAAALLSVVTGEFFASLIIEMIGILKSEVLRAPIRLDFLDMMTMLLEKSVQLVQSVHYLIFIPDGICCSKRGKMVTVDNYVSVSRQALIR